MTASQNSFSDQNQALQELERVYQDLSVALEKLGPRCEASGRCCNFLGGQYILFASELEIERVRREVHRRLEPWSILPTGECPFLIQKKCSIYPARPLGCRTYFCDPGYQPHEAEIYQRFIRKVAEISEHHGIAWNYRPFHGSSGLKVYNKAREKLETRAGSLFRILGQ